MADPTALPDSASLAPPRPGKRARWQKLLLADRRALIALVALVILVLGAVFAPYVSPASPDSMAFDMLTPPSWAHPLGTDDLGRDLLSRVIFGARISLFVGLVTVLSSMILGVIMGVLAGYYGGWLDTIIMRYIDLQWAFPNFIIAVYLVAVFGAGLTNVIVAVALAFLDDFARIARGMVLTVRERDFVEAARALGASDIRLMLRHILPNSMAPLIVQATVSVSYAILAEAGLSFLGLGVKASTPTWGLILSDGRSFIGRAWWLGIFPGVAIMMTVLSINFFGDYLRDVFDVRETGVETEA